MATNQLPDPESLPLFRYTDQSGNERELNDRDPNPRVITDYVFSSDKWQHLPAAKRTVDGIMAQSNSDDWRCIVCQRLGPGCLGPSCVASWMSKANDRLSEIEIRETGPMGLGVFAACGFSEGDIIEEYQGEILPEDAADDLDDAYRFGVRGVGQVSSKLYGNWTRFVNSRCINRNVVTVRKMYGKRIAMMLTAGRNIVAGEQLFINYGKNFFDASNIWCECDDISGNHLPPAPGDEISGLAKTDGTGRPRDPEPELTVDDDEFYAVPYRPQGETGPSGVPIDRMPRGQSGKNDARLTTTPSVGPQPALKPASPGNGFLSPPISSEVYRTRSITRRDGNVPTATKGNSVSMRLDPDPAANEDEVIEVDVKYRGRVIHQREVRVQANKKGQKEPVHVNVDVYLNKPGEGGAREVAATSGGGDSRGAARKLPPRALPTNPGSRPGPRGVIRISASMKNSGNKGRLGDGGPVRRPPRRMPNTSTEIGNGLEDNLRISSLSSIPIGTRETRRPGLRFSAPRSLGRYRKAPAQAPTTPSAKRHAPSSAPIPTPPATGKKPGPIFEVSAPHSSAPVKTIFSEVPVTGQFVIPEGLLAAQGSKNVL